MRNAFKMVSKIFWKRDAWFVKDLKRFPWFQRTERPKPLTGGLGTMIPLDGRETDAQGEVSGIAGPVEIDGLPSIPVLGGAGVRVPRCSGTKGASENATPCNE